MKVTFLLDDELLAGTVVAEHRARRPQDSLSVVQVPSAVPRLARRRVACLVPLLRWIAGRSDAFPRLRTACRTLNVPWSQARSSEELGRQLDSLAHDVIVDWSATPSIDPASVTAPIVAVHRGRPTSPPGPVVIPPPRADATFGCCLHWVRSDLPAGARALVGQASFALEEGASAWLADHWSRRCAIDLVTLCLDEWELGRVSREGSITPWEAPPDTGPTSRPPFSWSDACAVIVGRHDGFLADHESLIADESVHFGR